MVKITNIDRVCKGKNVVVKMLQWRQLLTHSPTHMAFRGENTITGGPVLEALYKISQKTFTTWEKNVGTSI